MKSRSEFKFRGGWLFMLGMALWNSVASANVQRDFFPDELRAAHQSYLDGKNQECVVRLKEVFDRYGSERVVSDNALELLKQVMKEGDAVSPPSTKLPGELNGLRIELSRRQRLSGVEYSLKMKAQLKTNVKIAGMTLKYFDGEKLLDPQDGLGSIEIDDTEPKTVVLARYGFGQAPQEGPVSIHVTFDNGVVWHGWAPLTNLVATRSPQVEMPSPGQVFKTHTPTFAWKDFSSPELREGESRGYYASVSVNDPWKELYGVYVKEEEMDTSLTIPESQALKNGDYVFGIKYAETHKFGDIRLVRSAATIRHFKIAVP